MSPRVGVVHARVGQIVTFFVYRPPSRPLGSLTPTQPGRVTNPTQGHPGPPWGKSLRQSACCSGVSPSQHRPSTGSCHRARSGSTAGPGQRLPPCMCSGLRRYMNDSICGAATSSGRVIYLSFILLLKQPSLRGTSASATRPALRSSPGVGQSTSGREISPHLRPGGRGGSAGPGSDVLGRQCSNNRGTLFFTRTGAQACAVLLTKKRSEVFTNVYFYLKWSLRTDT